MSTKSIERIYQIRVDLRETKPPIWRWLLVLDSTNLFKLHQIIQVAMGWTDSHLHQFIIGGNGYSIPNPYTMRPVLGESRFQLKHVAPLEKDKFFYEYDFGDSWYHQILVEKISQPDPDVKYPICIKGKRACPPEDVGGTRGYEDFLEAMDDPDHEDHHGFMEWWGGQFDPEAFDLEEINFALRRFI
jgi:hypothetical protein